MTDILTLSDLEVKLIGYACKCVDVGKINEVKNVYDLITKNRELDAGVSYHQKTQSGPQSEQQDGVDGQFAQDGEVANKGFARSVDSLVRSDGVDGQFAQDGEVANKEFARSVSSDTARKLKRKFVRNKRSRALKTVKRITDDDLEKLLFEADELVKIREFLHQDFRSTQEVLEFIEWLESEAPGDPRTIQKRCKNRMYVSYKQGRRYFVSTHCVFRVCTGIT